ncbi:MAG: heme lyase CcmF/NrfE family subunit [Actinobacteria bacterium]|nr:heme lyase CcmF/NrfE family subunit [Actinomycetota bacterium]
MAELGRAALTLTLCLALYALVVGGLAAATGRRRLADSARNALIASFATTLVGTVVLVASFLRDDFSITYVATHSSRSLDGLYKVSALWGGQAGSLLLWLLILTGFSAVVVWVNRRRARDLVAWVTPVLAGIAVGFSWILVAVSSPFATQLAPADGNGLNPSLQNPYMVSHPPILYIGYVGLAVPFAFAMGALLAGRTDERWIVHTRRSTLVAWSALGIGQLLGSHWAYLEVGWGGYFAWDPVENAALMPWLAATAFLHSVMIQEKRGMLRVWNVVLVSLAFGLSLFGTFLTRSGVINSIHSFSRSSIGPWFLALLVIAVAFATALIFWRLPILRAKTRLESLLSREATFLYNNLLLIALTLAILWGVAWPLVTEAVRGEAVVVGPPFYNFFLRIFGLPLLLLMGIAPLIAWRKASLRGVGRMFAWPLAVAVAAGVVLIALGAGSSLPGLLAYTFSAFVLAAIALEFWKGTTARRALTGEAWPAAFAQLMGRNRRRYGGYVVHVAIVMLAIGIAGSSAYDTVAENRKPLRIGDSLAVGDYALTYTRLEERDTDHHGEVRAVFDVRRGDSRLGEVAAGKNVYPITNQPAQISSEVGLRTDYLRAEDLFVIVQSVNENGTVNVRAFVKPLVNLIWLAGLVFLAGSLIALWPDAREERRLAIRYARAGTAVRGR